jgi:hypothetical protein
MPCENYREALIDAAATGEAPSLELAAHLNACSACREAFAEERQFFAAMDSGLRVNANAEVPLSLLPRVRARLNERTVQRHAWIPAAVATATTAVILVAVVLVREHNRTGPSGNAQASSVAETGGSEQTTNVVPSVGSVKGMTPSVSTKSIRTRQKTSRVGLHDPLILIAPGQRRAVAALVARVQQGAIPTDGLPEQETAKNLPRLSIEPLEIAPIEVKPLAELSAEPLSEAQQNEGNGHRQL